MTVKIPVRLQPVRVRRENDIQREVLEALRKMGKFCLRLQSGKVKVKGGWMQLCPEGTPDIVVIDPITRFSVRMGEIDYDKTGTFQRVTWIEMKKSDGVQADKQAEFQQAARSRGETYLLARSLDDVLKVLK